MPRVGRSQVSKRQLAFLHALEDRLSRGVQSPSRQLPQVMQVLHTLATAARMCDDYDDERWTVSIF